MKKYILRVFSAILITGILIVTTDYLNRNIEKTFNKLSNTTNYLGQTCAPETAETLYVNTETLTVRNSASGTRITEIDRCTEVKVYCRIGNWGRISNSSEKYILTTNLLSTLPTGCSSKITTTTNPITLNMSALNISPSPIYYGRDFDINFNLTNVKNLGEGEEDRISISVLNSTGDDVTDSFDILKTFDFDTKIMAVTVNNNINTLESGTYKIKVDYENGRTTSRNFNILGKEFDFDLEFQDNPLPPANTSATWVINLINQIPDTLTFDDFNIDIIDSTGVNRNSWFEISNNGNQLYINNIKREQDCVSGKDEEGKWQHSCTENDYAQEGTYTVHVALADTTDFANDKVPSYEKTESFRIATWTRNISEQAEQRHATRYMMDTIYSNYDIEILKKRVVDGISYYTIVENSVNGVAEIADRLGNEVSLQRLKETFPNENFESISFEPRNGNKVSVNFGGISIVRYYLVDGIYYIDFYANTSTSTVSTMIASLPSSHANYKQTFAYNYPTAYNALIYGINTEKIYLVDAETGDIRYHSSGIGTKVVKKITPLENTLPKASTGGKFKMKFLLDGYNSSQLDNLRLDLRHEGQLLIQNASLGLEGNVIDTNFSINIERSESPFEFYVTLEYFGKSDKYIGMYYLNLRILGAVYTVSLELTDSEMDYFVFASYDSHSQDLDYLRPLQNPNGNKRYEYYLGLYIMKAKNDVTDSTIITRDQIQMMGFQVFDHQATIDENGELTFFDEISYITKIKRLYENASGTTMIDFDLSIDGGTNYTPKTLTLSEYARNYEDAYEYIKDYTPGKKKLKNYNLDANGNIVSDNYSMHVINFSRAINPATDSEEDVVTYTTDASSEVQIAYMDKDWKRSNSEINYMINRMFAYKKNGDYILGALTGFHKVTTNADGSPIVGHDVTDQFYINKNINSTNPKDLLILLPKVEVDAGKYYVYVTYNGQTSIGYNFFYDVNNPIEEENATIDKDLYPQLWNRNVHMTEIRFDDPVYTVSFDDPVITNNLTTTNEKIKNVAFTNVESYVDLGLTLNYLYNLDGLTYKIQYKDGANWVDANEDFNILANIKKSNETSDENTGNLDIEVIYYKDNTIKFYNENNVLKSLSVSEFIRQHPDEWKKIDSGEYQFDEKGNILETDIKKFLVKSNIHLTSKIGQTRKGTYRLIMDYNYNGFKFDYNLAIEIEKDRIKEELLKENPSMTDAEVNKRVNELINIEKIKEESVSVEFEVSGNHYGIDINDDYENNFYFYHNFADTLTIPIEGYSTLSANYLSFDLLLDEETDILYTWNKANKAFYTNGGELAFTYNIETVEQEDKVIYNMKLNNFDSNHNPVAGEGKYILKVNYQEPGGILAETQTPLEVKPDTHVVKFGLNERAHAKTNEITLEDEMWIERDITVNYINYDELDSLEYVIYYRDPVERRYIPVSDRDSTKRMFTITYKWDESEKPQEGEYEKAAYHGKVMYHINQKYIDEIMSADSNNGTGFYIYVNYPFDDRTDDEAEMKDPKDLFSWELTSKKIYGVLQNGSEEIKVDGFYSNVNDTYIELDVDTIYENNFKYLITQDCGNYSCNPSMSSSYNERFEVIEQNPTYLKIKVKDGLSNDMRLEPGSYQIVIYYSNKDYKIYDFIVKSEYANISIDDYIIKTNIDNDNYIYNKLFSNKDSKIYVYASVLGIGYDQVNISITNSDLSKNYENYFTIDKEKFIDSHVLEITYNKQKDIPGGMYTLMLYRDNDDGRVYKTIPLVFNNIYYNIELTGVSYNPNPAVPNAENGGNVIIDVETSDLLYKSFNENNLIRQELTNNVVIKNEKGDDVTSLFTKTYVTGAREDKFKVNLKYEKDTLQPGIYVAEMTYTLEGYSVLRTIEFMIGDFERKITITGVDIRSNTSDNKIHNNAGGTYIINYTTNHSIFTRDLNVLVESSRGINVTNKFVITKEEGKVNIKYEPQTPELEPDNYKVTLIYTDPTTSNVDRKSVDIRMYGNYKEIEINNIVASKRPIIAENNNQYYTYNLITSNLTSDEISNIKTRIYDKYGNIVYSNIPTDNSSNLFSLERVSNDKFKVNILPYKTRVDSYYVVNCLEDGFGGYFESNRLELTIDDTLYKVNILNSRVTTKERINNTDYLYDFIGVNGQFEFTTTYPEAHAKYTIQILNKGKIIKEIDVNALFVEASRQINFEAIEISHGELEFAICINGLPYASTMENVLEYIKITNATIIINNQDVLTDIKLAYGDTDIQTYIEPVNATNKNLVFTSSNLDVATIEGNKITVIGSGETIIRASNKEFVKEFKVIVDSKLSSNIYEINEDDKTIFVNKMTSKTMDTTTFINNLQNKVVNYQILNKNGQNVTDTTNVVGTGYKFTNGSDTYTIIVLGDLNGNGYSGEFADVMYLLDVYRGSQRPNDYILKAGKITKKATIGLSDVTKLLDFYRNRIREI